MYLHARVYRVMDLVEVDLRTAPSVDEAGGGETPTYRTFTGALPDELEGQPELVVLLDALRAAARTVLRDIEGGGPYQGPPTLR